MYSERRFTLSAMSKRERPSGDVPVVSPLHPNATTTGGNIVAIDSDDRVERRQ
jgi:hypothetical protein